ncbi:adenosylcobinamide-GDP ribazoletransferase [Pyrococcus sp. ST04]|uniref:adenosylcobinamide-GDP ribazoletransferase n=1 Tax=Pyrococcus sp. ST04 TaxID=1183377 RepID=UPI0002605A74|nr:adenosylcobinamide-GDP ribazoletransferase [Pyrococcus sp. ST04]AFK22053.1 putative cobalamin synthase [Pyrococcus sp. ST04]
MRNLIPFFTRIPLRGDFEKAREELWALPLIAVLTSLLPMLILYLDIPLANVLSLLALYFIIGLLHLDGLADWADGIMVKGSRERKIKAMKDVNTGIAGVFAVVSVMMIQAYSLSLVPWWAFFLGELNSKLSMLLAISTRKPLGEGLGKFFMDGVKRRDVLIGLGIYALFLAILAYYSPPSLLGILGLVPGLYALHLSIENFGGLNGDCIGAIAEITRAGTFLVLALVFSHS